MTDSDSVIVAAKHEYTSQLCTILTPLIHEGLKSIWKTCKSDNKKELRTFQEKLCLVHKWNQEIIDNEYSRIIKKTDCAWLDKLLEAIFLSNIKILSTIRIGKTKTINVKVPETKKFIHKCYIEASRALWKDPYPIDDRESVLSYSEIKRNNNRLNTLISESIKITISQAIPIEDILQKYMSELSSDSESESDSEDEKSINKDEISESLEEKSLEIQPESSHSETFGGSEEPRLSIDSEKDPYLIDDLINKNTGGYNSQPDLSISTGSSIDEAKYQEPPQNYNTPEIKRVVVSNRIGDDNSHDDSPFFSDSDQD